MVTLRSLADFTPSLGRPKQRKSFSEGSLHEEPSSAPSARSGKFSFILGAHCLLQTRTAVLNGELRGQFERWYPELGEINGAEPNGSVKMAA